MIFLLCLSIPIEIDPVETNEAWINIASTKMQTDRNGSAPPPQYENKRRGINDVDTMTPCAKNGWRW
jgi:hypothetical protein